MIHAGVERQRDTVSSQAPIGWRSAATALMPLARQTTGETRPMAPERQGDDLERRNIAGEGDQGGFGGPQENADGSR